MKKGNSWNLEMQCTVPLVVMFAAYTMLTDICFDIILTETKLKVDDLGRLERFLQPVSPYWVSIADQLGMTTEVDIIRGTPTNLRPSDFMRDVLHRWLSSEHPSPTLETLCQALRGYSEIVGGENVASKLEKEFRSTTGL